MRGDSPTAEWDEMPLDVLDDDDRVPEPDHAEQLVVTAGTVWWTAATPDD